MWTIEDDFLGQILRSGRVVSGSEVIKGKYSVNELSEVLKLKSGLFKHYNSNKVNFNVSLFPMELSISSIYFFH